MPKLVDHEERRRLIAQATWRVISRDGVRAASVRTVAAEAGLSTGALRHYFDDHASLLLFAARHSLELMAARGVPAPVPRGCRGPGERAGASGGAAAAGRPARGGECGFTSA